MYSSDVNAFIAVLELQSFFQLNGQSHAERAVMGVEPSSLGLLRLVHVWDVTADLKVAGIGAKL